MAKEKKEVGKYLLERKVKNSIGVNATISKKVQYSPNHILLYTGEQGVIKAFDLGTGEADDMIVLIEIELTIGDKKRRTAKHEVWVHALDVEELR